MSKERTFGRLFGEAMKLHPKADVRIVNDILKLAFDEWANSDTQTREDESPMKRDPRLHGYTCVYCTGDKDGVRPHWPHREGYEYHMQTVHYGLLSEWSAPRSESEHEG